MMGPGSGPLRVRPKMSLSWPMKMVAAIPAVKPTVTGCGISRTKPPSLSTPSTASIAPDIITASSMPSMPKRATVAATSTTKAAAGPPIWNRLPPKADIRKPPTMAV